MSLGLETEADFGATIRIQGLDVVFGLSGALSKGIKTTGTFELRNTDTSNVHIALPGESFGDGNRRVGGSSRTVVIDDFFFGKLVTFRAGRNDQVLASVTGPPVLNDIWATVAGDGSQLRCSLQRATEGPPEACCIPPAVGYEDYPGETSSQHCIDIGTRPILLERREDCEGLEGVPQGPNTTCANRVCNEPFQACCRGPQSGCIELLCDRGVAYNDHPQGAGVHCDARPCTHPLRRRPAGIRPVASRAVLAMTCPRRMAAWPVVRRKDRGQVAHRTSVRNRRNRKPRAAGENGTARRIRIGRRGAGLDLPAVRFAFFSCVVLQLLPERELQWATRRIGVRPECAAVYRRAARGNELSVAERNRRAVLRKPIDAPAPR